LFTGFPAFAHIPTGHINIIFKEIFKEMTGRRAGEAAASGSVKVHVKVQAVTSRHPPVPVQQAQHRGDKKIQFF
jgi:hypothetical protein